MRTLWTSPPAISSTNDPPIRYLLHRMSADAGVRPCERSHVRERAPHRKRTEAKAEERARRGYR